MRKKKTFCATNAKLFLENLFISFETWGGKGEEKNKAYQKEKIKSLTPLQNQLLVFDITHDPWGLTAARGWNMSAHRQFIWALHNQQHKSIYNTRSTLRSYESAWEITKWTLLLIPGFVRPHPHSWVSGSSLLLVLDPRTNVSSLVLYRESPTVSLLNLSKTYQRHISHQNQNKETRNYIVERKWKYLGSIRCFFFLKKHELKG